MKNRTKKTFAPRADIRITPLGNGVLRLDSRRGRGAVVRALLACAWNELPAIERWIRAGNPRAPLPVPASLRASPPDADIRWTTAAERAHPTVALASAVSHDSTQTSRSEETEQIARRSTGDGWARALKRFRAEPDPLAGDGWAQAVDRLEWEVREGLVCTADGWDTANEHSIACSRRLLMHGWTRALIRFRAQCITAETWRLS